MLLHQTSANLAHNVTHHAQLLHEKTAMQTDLNARLVAVCCYDFLKKETDSSSMNRYPLCLAQKRRHTRPDC